MKKHHNFNFLLILISITSFLCTSCATVFKGSTDNVKFTSEPTGAAVYVNGKNMGKAPISLELKSNVTYKIEFKLDGYDTKYEFLNKSLNAGYLVLDILCGVFPAVIIDAVTGDWYNLDQENINMILEKSK